MRTVRGRVILVTGASAGIGRATTERLVCAGATVVGCGRDGARLAALAAATPGVETQVCDVTDPGDRAALIDGVLARHGRIDVLVNNAGVGWEGLVEGHCCVVAGQGRPRRWRGPRSDGGGELGERNREPLRWADIGGEFVVAAP